MRTDASLLTPFIQSVVRTCDVRSLVAAAERLHKKYTGASFKPLEGMAEHVAYVACRMPATFAAIVQALRHLQQVLPAFEPANVLDIGAGPGTALLGSLTVFPSITRGIGLDRSPEFCGLSEQLFSHIPAMNTACRMVRCDLEREPNTEGSFDLITSAYAFGELSVRSQDRWLAWAKGRTKALLLVEPGTPAGWQCLMRCREKLVALGASLLAPCPHAKQCPFEGSEQWCHEAVRVQRSALHRRLKGGMLGYEDEKLSYLAVAFDPQLPRVVPPCRIVHAPRHRHGHTHLVLCTVRGQLEPTIISRRYQELYRLAREAKWGDALPSMKEDVEPSSKQKKAMP